MTCKDCDTLDSCKNPDGTTRFMGKDAACNNVESLCDGFSSPNYPNCDLLSCEVLADHPCERYYHVVCLIQTEGGAGVNSFQFPSAEPLLTCDGLKKLQQSLSEQLQANVHILNIIELDEV